MNRVLNYLAPPSLLGLLLTCAVLAGPVVYVISRGAAKADAAKAAIPCCTCINNPK